MPNDTIQPAAAKTVCHQDRPDPPLGFTALLSADELIKLCGVIPIVS
jgi:hypothetical protein